MTPTGDENGFVVRGMVYCVKHGAEIDKPEFWDGTLECTECNRALRVWMDPEYPDMKEKIESI